MDRDRGRLGMRGNADHARSGVAGNGSVRVVVNGFRASHEQEQTNRGQRDDAHGPSNSGLAVADSLHGTTDRSVNTTWAITSLYEFPQPCHSLKFINSLGTSSLPWAGKLQGQSCCASVEGIARRFCEPFLRGWTERKLNFTPSLILTSSQNISPSSWT